MKGSRMKKFAAIGLSLLAILVVGVSLAAAQGAVDDDAPVAPGVNFIDEDGDGQCDLYGTDQAGNGGVGAGQGFGSRNSGAGGANFVDENGDGQCDLMGAGAAGQGSGFGPQGGNGVGFVDEDGDGSCDLAGTGQAGGGQGSGQRGRVGNGSRGGAGNGLGRGMGQSAWGADAAQ